MDAATGWTAIVPVRGFGTAKSRLRPDLPASTVAEIARRLAQGCVRTLNRAVRVDVVIVVSDVAVQEHFPEAQATFLVQQVGGGLNGAVREGLALAASCSPHAPRLVIHADLPGINPQAVDSLLADLPTGGKDVYIPDRAGTGTTALALRAGSRRPVGFGVGSAARHLALGYAPVRLPADSVLRNDLDTLESLRALRWGSTIDLFSENPAA